MIPIPNHVKGLLIEGAKRNVIRIPVTCKRGCLFCLQKQGGDKFPFDPFKHDIPIKDYLDIFKELNYDEFIYFYGGDIFDYPIIYDIIEALLAEIRSRGKSPKIEIISTFADFNPEKLEMLKSYQNFFLVLSGITFDTRFKNYIMNSGWSEKQTEAIKAMIAEGVFSQVVVWDFGFMNILASDFHILKECAALLWEKSPEKRLAIILSYPSTTKYADPIAQGYNRLAIENYEKAVELFNQVFSDVPNVKKVMYSLRDLSDEELYKGFIDFHYYQDDMVKRVKSALSFLNDKGIRLSEVGFVASPSCYNYARQKFPGLNWVKANNDYFGGDVIVSSLLTFDDVEKAAKPFKNYIMTKDMLKDSGGRADVLRRTIEDFEQKNNCRAFFF